MASNAPNGLGVTGGLGGKEGWRGSQCVVSTSLSKASLSASAHYFLFTYGRLRQSTVMRVYLSSIGTAPPLGSSGGETLIMKTFKKLLSYKRGA